MCESLRPSTEEEEEKKKRLRECREEIERVAQQVWQNGRRAAFSPHAPKAEQGISIIRLIKFPRRGFGENSVGDKSTYVRVCCEPACVVSGLHEHPAVVRLRNMHTRF